MKKLLLLLTMFGVVFAQIRNDDWVDSGQMLRFPASRFFTAVGIGNTETLARENALVEIRRQISATVQSEQILREFSILTNNSAADTSILNTKNRITVDGNVAGVEIIATATRENRHFAFAALEKEKFIALQRTKIRELQGELTKTNNLADRAIRENNIALAITHLNSANEIISAIQNERLTLSAAAVLTENERVPVSRAEIDGKLAGVANSIRMVSSEPFSVKITANNNPVENLPISLLDERNRVVASSRTDKNGNAKFNSDEFMPTTRGTYRFTAKIDLPQVQNLPTVQFSHTVRTQNLSAQITVSVSQDLRGAASTIERAVGEMFSHHGITNDRNAAARITVSVSDTPRERIEGVSESRSFTRSNAVVLVSVQGKQPFSATFENVGTGSNRNAAVNDGIRKIRFGDALSDIQRAIENAK